MLREIRKIFRHGTSYVVVLPANWIRAIFDRAEQQGIPKENVRVVIEGDDVLTIRPIFDSTDSSESEIEESE